MAKAKPSVSPRKKPAGGDHTPAHRKDGIRETIESVVIAFVLAFLFRAFEAEAFVIPTGSMAPTLMGVHKDLTCKECGFPYRVSASNEQEEEATQERADMQNSLLSKEARAEAARRLANHDVINTICPNCHYEMDIDPQTAEGRMYPSYKGDRILVAKFPYDFSDPHRWDVVVFKYPRTANENYIKRCVGLAGETIAIHGGNIYTRDGDGPGRTIQRKPPDKVRAMMQTVYDNDYLLVDLLPANLPLRWVPLDANAVDAASSGAWQLLNNDKSYRTEGASDGASWLGYQHRVPSQADWRQYKKSGKFVDAGGEIPPRLISDFYAYNAFTERGFGPGYHPDVGFHWVGDLILECELTCEPSGKSSDPQAVLRLIKGGRPFDCTIDVNTGKAHLAIVGADLGATADTPIRPGTRHMVSFANVDCQLLLWVDGREIEFDRPTTYEAVENEVPTIEDLTPARIGSRGAGLEVNHLRILRDVYYVACLETHGRSPLMVDYETPVFNGDGSLDAARFLSNPKAWPRAFANMRTVEFPLRADEFLMLGDNSPRSKDSRLWTGHDEEGRVEHFVKRDLLVGKAVFVYWPHSWNRIPGTRIPFPFFPNFARMKFVR